MVLKTAYDISGRLLDGASNPASIFQCVLLYHIVFLTDVYNYINSALMTLFIEMSSEYSITCVSSEVKNIFQEVNTVLHAFLRTCTHMLA